MSDFTESELADEARRRVAWPAGTLTVLASVWCFILLRTLSFNAWLLYSGMAKQLPPPRFMPKETEILIRAAWALVMIIVNSRILVWSVRMKNLQGFNTARWACYLGLIPCVGPFYCLGMPFCFWGLTVLRDPEVGQAFDRAEESETEPSSSDK